MKITIDDRESRSGVIKKLFEREAEYEVKRLELGDYVISEKCCVERKSAADFEASVMDGRLFAQAVEMKTNYERPLIALVGNDFARLNPRSLRGALWTLALKFNIPVLALKDEDEFVDFLLWLQKKEAECNSGPAKLQFEKKGLSLKQNQELIIQSFPMLGPSTAKDLLMHFGSVKGIVNASTPDLQAASGVGKTRAEKIREICDAIYLD